LAKKDKERYQEQLEKLEKVNKWKVEVVAALKKLDEDQPCGSKDLE